jgi:DNA sulfur modification protein DndD
MILEQLTLRNFCLFQGKQVFDLTPGERNGKRRPIVLFGGINGGGKTTLFDAIQLALYGSRARCSKRSSLSYDDFLLRSIHNGVGQDEGAGVSLSFRHAGDGEQRDYEVRRDWRVEEGKVRENLTVLQDGLLNNSLSRNWPQTVEELIPLEISQLFFFDGEKIRALAEDATSSQALGAAIKVLLGLDIVERLIGDATVLQGRLAKQAGSPEQLAEGEAVEQELREIQSQLEAGLFKGGSLENELLRAKEEQKQVEERFAAGGGRHWNEREARAGRKKELTAICEDLEARLVALAAGELPLALVPELLAGVASQDAEETRAAEAEIIQRLLQERDAQLVKALRSLRPAPEVVTFVREHLARDRKARTPGSSVANRLGLSEHGRALLHHLRGQRLADLALEGRDLLDKLGQAQREREDVERGLADTPAEDDIERLIKELNAATAKVTRLTGEKERVDAASKTLRTKIEDCNTRLERIWETGVKKEFDREDRGKMAELAGKTRVTMQDFLRKATERKIDRLSGLITESFRYLLRKKTLVERILIDPGSFAITLYDAEGHDLPRERLSEGEKQIFAVSMLWGLARASARPLPAVIDTPMARLDAAHRQHLVERYFPNASHQVVILSTDTEVDRHYYELLQPSIARAYHLSYDDQARMTVAEEGYFWKAEGTVGVE